MFEENNLTLMLSLPYDSGHFGLSMENRYTDWDVKMGQPTIFQVKSDGSQPTSIGGRCVNPLHPRVRQEVQAAVTELADRYASYPAVKSIMLISGHLGWLYPCWSMAPAFAPGENLDNSYLSSGYDDFTINLFEAEARVKIPVADTPQRFSERHDYILKHLRQPWIDFRCRQMAQTKLTLAAALRLKNPHLDLFAVDYWHYQEYTFARDPDPLYQKLKKIGTDLSLYKPIDRFYYGYYFNELDTCHEYDQCWLPRPLRQNLRFDEPRPQHLAVDRGKPAGRRLAGPAVHRERAVAGSEATLVL